jgi:two-component system NtrC family sensor kinase
METTTALYILAGFFILTAAALVVASLRFARLKRSLRHSFEPPSPLPASGDRQRWSSELQAVFDSITDDICIIDENYRVCNANKSYARRVGKSLPDILGKKCHALYWNREASCDHCPAAKTFKTGEPVLRTKCILRRGEEQKHLEISAYPIRNEQGRIPHVIEYIRDMTQESAMLEQLIRSEKLAGIGVMTTGIAHEMNNALSGIAGTASNLLTMPEKFGLTDKAVNRIFSILDAATRATSVMKNLLQFSSPMREETRIMVNVRQLIKKLIANVYIQEAPDIERRMSFDESLPVIKADPSKIELVFMNVISNAIRSIGEKKLRCAKENKPYKGSLVVSARTQNEQVLVTVTDNGVGIPEQIRSKIFDPFFSTWPEGKGTGLGLSTALHIVEEHGGRIFFESVDDLTTFSIMLPIDYRRPADALMNFSAEPPRTGR